MWLEWLCAFTMARHSSGRTTIIMEKPEEKSATESVLPDSIEQENRRVSRFVTWLESTGVLVLLVIGLWAVSGGDSAYGQVLFLFAALLAANELTFRLTRRASWHRNCLVVIVLVLYGFLVSTGGQSNTGPLWFYVVLPMAFFITGLRAGSLMVGGGILYSFLVFRFPELPWVTTRYHPDFQLRFLASVLFVSAFSAILDHQRRKARQELFRAALQHEHAAKTDEMTGLPNRRAMLAELNREWYRYHRAGHHFSLVLIDLDYFKVINDHYGHDAGDRVLESFSALLKSACRESDLASRWGGEEFLVLLPDTTLLDALSLAERIRQATERETIIHEEQRIPLTLSAGVSSITQATDLEDLLKQVDKNLYLSKEMGRNRITPGVKQEEGTGQAR